MSNVATLKLQGTSDLSKIVTDLKGIGTESKTAGTNLKSVTTELDKGTKSATSFGQKVKSFGSTFSSSIASIGTLGGTVLNLSRQYQDLGDSQISVDKAQLKVSKTTEATGTATKKLNDLVAKGVTSGAEYEQALLDVKQAQEAQSLATQMLTEKEEDHQRAQENFWIGLVPTVTSAGGSVMAVLKDMGGTKGFGGLKTAITGLGGKAGGLIGGLVSGLGGIGGAASGSVGGLNGMSTATVGLGAAMKGVALSMLPVAIAIAGIALAAKASSMVIHEIVSLIKGDTLEAVTSLEGLINLLDTISQVIGPAGAGFAALSNLKFTGIGSMKDQVAKLKAELQGIPQTVTPASASLERLDQGAQSLNGIIDSLVGGVLGFTKKAGAVPAPANAAAGGMENMGTAANGLGTNLGTTSGQITTFVGGTVGLLDVLNQGISVFGNFTKAVDPMGLGIAAVGIAADNALAPLNAVKASSLAGANAFAQQSRRANELAATLNKATQSLNRMAQAQNKIGSSLGQGSYTIGAKVGQQASKGGHYVTFRGGKQVGGGPGIAPPFKKKKAATGMHEMVNQPTWILAGESGQERVDIDSPGRGGGGGDVYIGPIYLDGELVMGRMRYKMNKFQGVMK
jgi:hypothetical protein